MAARAETDLGSRETGQPLSTDSTTPRLYPASGRMRRRRGLFRISHRLTAEALNRDANGNRRRLLCRAGTQTSIGLLSPLPRDLEPGHRKMFAKGEDLADRVTVHQSKTGTVDCIGSVCASGQSLPRLSPACLGPGKVRKLFVPPGFPKEYAPFSLKPSEERLIEQYRLLARIRFSGPTRNSVIIWAMPGAHRTPVVAASRCRLKQ